MKKIHYAPQYFMDPTHPITITVVGVGGNGSQVLHDLAKMHVSLLELGYPGLYVEAIDDDKIEQSNIGRQKFSPTDIGDYKSSVLITRINRFYGLEWKALTRKYESSDGDANIIISAVDNVDTREKIGESLWASNSNRDYQQKYYWLDFGNGKDFGQFVLGSVANIEQPKSKYKTINQLKTVLDLFPNMKENEDITEPSCSTREALLKQDLFINSILVSTGMNLIWQLLTKYVITHHGGYINLATCQTKPIKL